MEVIGWRTAHRALGGPAVLAMALLLVPTGMAGVHAQTQTQTQAQSPARVAAPAAAPSAASACPALLQYSFDRLQDDKPQPLCQYAGKVLLIVNTASYCGFTPQYEGLEALHARFAARGLVVMGFPSNDFGRQEPGGKREIAELCFNTYGVKFPMFAKTVVVGPQAHPLFVSLAQATGNAPGWNFHKYLVDRQGRPVASYASSTEPGDRALAAAIEKALTQR